MSLKYSATASRRTRGDEWRRFLSAARSFGVSLAIAALAIAPVSVLTSCSRKATPKEQAKSVEKTVANATPAPAAPKPVQSAPPAQIPPPATPTRPIAARPAPAPIAAPIAASMRAFGLRAASVPRIAWDFSLGPLQSSRPAAGDEAAAFAAARSFAEAMKKGKLDSNLLLPEARDALSVLLAPPEPGSDSPSAIPYRLGAIALQGSGASLRIRMDGSAGASRVEGLLSLRKVGDEWFVEALALDPPASGILAFSPDTSASP